MTRRSLTRLQRVRIFDAAGGVCHICQARIHAGRGERWDVEHVKPLSLGGSDNEANMRPAHVGCHSQKTKDEAPTRAKVYRIRAKHLGIKKSGRGFPGGKSSAFKKKVDGTVVLRRPHTSA